MGKLGPNFFCFKTIDEIPAVFSNSGRYPVAQPTLAHAYCFPRSKRNRPDFFLRFYTGTSLQLKSIGESRIKCK